MNSLKKGEGVPLLKFEGDPGYRVPGSLGSGSWGPGQAFTPCQLNISGKILAEANFMRDDFFTLLYLNKLIRNMT